MRWKNEGSDSWVTRLSAVVLFALLSIVGVGSSAQAQSGKAAPSGNVENGKKLFTANRCWECHDDKGQGGNGPQIGPTSLSVTAVTAYLRHPKGQMPPYIAKVVSDEEIADIYAFLQSQPKSPSAKTIPLLNQ